MFRSNLFTICEEFDKSQNIIVVGLIGENLSTVQEYGERLSRKIDRNASSLKPTDRLYLKPFFSLIRPQLSKIFYTRLVDLRVSTIFRVYTFASLVQFFGAMQCWNWSDSEAFNRLVSSSETYRHVSKSHRRRSDPALRRPLHLSPVLPRTWVRWRAKARPA